MSSAAIPSPRWASCNPNQIIYWSDGTTQFNGYAVVQLLLPKINAGTNWGLAAYGNLSPSIQLPINQKIPIVYGVPNIACGLFWNSDITPPGSGYVAWYYDATDTQVCGPSSTFFINASTVLSAPTNPIYGGGQTGSFNLPTAGLTFAIPNAQQSSSALDSPVTPGLNQ